MAVQPFYYLCKFEFIDDQSELVKDFINRASPKQKKAEKGIYVTEKPAPFLDVCGKRFHHKGIPVIPVLHIKQWPIKTLAKRYIPMMENAKKEILDVLK